MLAHEEISSHRCVCCGVCRSCVGHGACRCVHGRSTGLSNERYAVTLDLLTPYAKDGNVEAAFLLGEMYGPRSWGQQGENRNGVEQDNRLAIYWWTQAAKAGHAQ